MPVSLTNLRNALYPGLWSWSRKGDPLSDLPARFGHIRALKHGGRISNLGQLLNLPRCFTSPAGVEYEEHIVSAGREYPQGWGRTRDVATGKIIYDEPGLGPDGKVEVFKTVRNRARKELDGEISGYLDYRSGVRPSV